MSELKLVSPLLSNMEVVSCVSTRGGSSVYIVRSSRSGQSYYLKHISIPESQKQVDALMFTGAASTVEDAQGYYKQIAADYQQELETLETLSASPNIGCYRSYQIEPKEDGVGFDLYLLAEYRKTLLECMDETPMTHAGAVNLGLDLCSALGSLREAGLIHRNVKPSNVYLGAQEHYLLGDLGIAKIDELKYCSMPEEMLSSFSAPELFSLVGTLEPTADIYSVGMILYYVYNGRHGPFEDEKTSPRAADKLRVTGSELPAPMYADYEMAEIIRKACAFQPADRYQTPQEMREALVDYAKRNETPDTPIVPPIEGEHQLADPHEEEPVEPVQFADTETMEEDFKESFSPDTAILNAIIDEIHRETEAGNIPDPDEQPEPEQPSGESSEPEDGEKKITLPARERTKPKKKRRRKSRWILPVLLTLLILGGAGFAVWHFFIAPTNIFIDNIRVTNIGTSHLTVLAESKEPAGTFDLTCSDAYGNQNRKPCQPGTAVTFEGLASGTQYTIAAYPNNGEKLNGTYSTTATTNALTELLSFTATPVSVTQAELNLIVRSGPDPELWTVTYGAQNVPAKTVAFAGHSVVISDLRSNTEYTFTLQAPENTELTGQTSVTFSTVPTVDIVPDSTTVALSSTSAILTWQYEGDAPEAWNVTLEDADGNVIEQSVSVPNVTFENLTSGMEYRATISCPSMLHTYTMRITPTITKLTEFTATPVSDANGFTQSVQISWTCETDPTNPGWTVTYRQTDLPDSEPVTVETSEQSITIDTANVYPNAGYEVSIAQTNGDELAGQTSLTFRTANPNRRYTARGVTTPYTGLFLAPDKETFRYLDLSQTRTSFQPTEKIAFDIESLGAVNTGSSEMTTINLVIRKADGTFVDVHTYQMAWNTMWEKNMFVGAFPRTPQEEGNYVLSIYFGSALVSSAEFEIKK